MVKRTIIIVLALMICFYGSARAIPSIVSPNFEITPTLNLPGIGEIFFAKDTIETFLGTKWQIYDAFYMNVLYRRDIVGMTFNDSKYDYNWLAIVMSPERIYYMTPIIIDDTMIFDYTDVKPGQYKIYLIHNIINNN